MIYITTQKHKNVVHNINLDAFLINFIKIFYLNIVILQHSCNSLGT